MDYLRIYFNKTVTVFGFPCGSVCGLVVITPACGFVPLWSSIIIGMLGATASFLYGQHKHLFYKNAEDTLDVFGCHGISGIMGGICTGLFAKNSINPAVTGTHDGAFYGNRVLLGYQIAGILATSIWSFGISHILLIVIKKTMGLSLTDE